MADITAGAVKALREKTGAGMMECKKALTEAEGNEERAIDILRERGLASAKKKEGRVAAEGASWSLRKPVKRARVESLVEHGIPRVNAKCSAQHKEGGCAGITVQPVAGRHTRGKDPDEMPLAEGVSPGRSQRLLIRNIPTTVGSTTTARAAASADGASASSQGHGPAPA